MAKQKAGPVVVPLEIEVPQVPNFVHLVSGATGGDAEVAPSVSIAHLGDADLQRLGKAWTEKLIERAQELREEAAGG